jgi:hypothetical protein
MKITLKDWIKTLNPYKNKIAQKQEEIEDHMNNVHATQNTPTSSSKKQTWSSPQFSYIRVECSKGLALYCKNQRIA